MGRRTRNALTESSLASEPEKTENDISNQEPAAIRSIPQSANVPQSTVPSRKRQRSGRVVEGSGEPIGVTLNHLDITPGRNAVAHLSRDRRTLTGLKGYKLVKATRGVSKGTWYCEFSLPLESARSGGHVRVGWANDAADSHAPVGFDEHSYAIRDILGSRVHQSIRTAYGEGRSLVPGDVIGCLISFDDVPSNELQAAEESATGAASAGPADGGRVRHAQRIIEDTAGCVTRRAVESILFSNEPPRRLPWSTADDNNVDKKINISEENGKYAGDQPNLGILRFGEATLDGDGDDTRINTIQPTKTLHWQVGDPEPKNAKRVVNRRHWNSCIRFHVNGVDQGIAFVHLTRENRYYPAASCYDGGSVRFNPGPDFAFPPYRTPSVTTTVKPNIPSLHASSSSSPTLLALATTVTLPALQWGEWRAISELSGTGDGSFMDGTNPSGNSAYSLQHPQDNPYEPSIEGFHALLSAMPVTQPVNSGPSRSRASGTGAAVATARTSTTKPEIGGKLYSVLNPSSAGRTAVLLRQLQANVGNTTAPNNSISTSR